MTAPLHNPSGHMLDPLLAGRPLTEAEARELFDRLLTGGLAEADIAAVLGAIAQRGATVDELVGAARAMRDHATRIPIGPTTLPILDTCGTGGAPKLFNVSTLGAIITAAAARGRVIVAKHGNRSRTGRGSAELLEALGVNIHAAPDVQARCVREIGVCFAFAPDHHPAARFASSVRKRLAFPTIFNLLGPLVNPAGATCQLVGTYSAPNAEKLAHALARLGTTRAMVVCSHDGLDEVATTAPTSTYDVCGRQVFPNTLDALALGLPRTTIARLRADTLDEAAAIARAVLAGTSGPTLDMALLNAAASLHIAGEANSVAEALPAAREAVAAGQAARVLRRLVELSNGA